MSTMDPGLDRHDWETHMASLEEQLDDDPSAALPDLADFVERMLDESGYALDDPVTRSGDDPAVVADYTAAREVADRVERAEPVDPGDVGQAIENLRALYAYLVSERPMTRELP